VNGNHFYNYYDKENTFYSHTFFIISVSIAFIIAYNVIPIHSQSVPTIYNKIIGRVIDANSGEPLHLVNVFLSNTTLGSATNKDGKYSIEKIIPGHYELVVTMIGYKHQKMNVLLLEGQEKLINIKLHEKVIRGERVTVFAKPPKEWKKNLKIFEYLFLGIHEFSKKCKLTNPEYLDFQYDRITGEFRAQVEEPIHFVNLALGYKVTYLISEFYVELGDYVYENMGSNPEIQILRKGPMRYYGTAKFEIIPPKNEKERKKWIKNRLIVYYGSKMHFFKSLCNGTWKKEDFVIYDNSQNSKLKDDADEYEVTAEELIKMDSNKNLYLLYYQNSLKIIYKNKIDEIKYKRLLFLWGGRNAISGPVPEALARSITKECKYQTSWLSFTNGSVVELSTNGTIINGHMNFTVMDHWGWYGAAEWLPSDYQPHH